MDRIVSPQQTDNYLFEEIDNILFIEPIPLFHTSFTMDGIVSLPGTDDYLYEGIENILSAVKTDTDYIEPLDFDEEPEVDSRGDSSNSSEHTRQQTNPTIQCTTMITRLDVVAGRGQGIQRLPGNKRYRKLVSMNKKIYARCNSNDKCKVSRGIVAAIRQSGGRFLEYNEHSRSYHDIDDRKTWAKTSQALREGLKKIRTTIYFDEAAGHPQSGLDTHLLGSHRGECVAAERYIEISVRFLQSIDETDETS
jgi:hypothetical protein